MLNITRAADYCRKLTARSRSNFYYAFLFLPRERREALEAVYAFCRLVDDVVDEEAPAATKLAGIDRWRREVAAVYAPDGTPDHPVSQELRKAIRRFAIHREDLEAVIDGCAMDIEKSSYESWDELQSYCYRVASAVGLMCIEIFGYSSPGARQYAIELGLALQLTNIVRDVREDAQRGRVYLPAQLLSAHGVSAADLAAGRRTSGVRRMLREAAARAESHYGRARAAISASERKQLVIAEIMGDIYHALLERMVETDFDVFGEKPTVRRRRKMAIALSRFARAKLFVAL